MTLKLEVGKFYLSDYGNKIGPLLGYGENFQVSFTHERCAGYLWHPDGTEVADRENLVSEWTDEEQPREHWSKRHPGPIGIECRQCPECGLVPIGHSCLNAERSTCLLDAKPCRSPYCECEQGKCTHPGSYDARGTAPDTNPKTRIGLTKPSLRGIPSTALLHLGGAMHDGIEKYGQFNWREHTVSASVYEDAIWRHLLAWRDREDIAADSGRHHLAHVMACCAILLDAEAMGKLNDDRGLPGNAPDIIAAWTKKAIDTPS